MRVVKRVVMFEGKFFCWGGVRRAERNEVKRSRARSGEINKLFCGSVFALVARPQFPISKSGFPFFSWRRGSSWSASREPDQPVSPR